MTEDEQEIARIDARAAAQQAKSQYLKEHEGEADAEEQANREAVKAYHSSLRDSYFNSENNVQAKKDFEQHYDEWLHNKRLNPNETDEGSNFVRSSTFTNNEAEFKNAMLENYLDNLGSSSPKAAWENAINAGEESLLALAEAQQTEGKGLTGTLNAKAFKYTLNPTNKKTKKTKTSFGKGTSFKFLDAEYDKNGKKILQIDDPDNTAGAKAWIYASNVSDGSKIFDLLYNSKSITGQRAGVEELSKEIDTVTGEEAPGYYGSLINTEQTISGITRSALTSKKALNATTFRTDQGISEFPSSKNNSIIMTDISGLKWKKGKITKISKIQISAIQPDGREMMKLDSPHWVAGSILKAVMKKLNAQLKSNPGLQRTLTYLNAYKEGGIIDFTGPAWVDGTKARPESILSADQTAFLREDLLGNSNTSLKSILATVADSFGGNISTNNNSRTDDSVVIENIDVTFESGVIDSDYDMKRASDMFKDELVRIARKSGNRNVSRR